MICPLCAGKSSLFYQKKHGQYYQCEKCELTFLDQAFHLAGAGDKERYSHHNNDLSISGYREFLTKALAPLLPYLKPGMVGLDWGCGPFPNAEKLLGERGHECKSYDLYFTDESSLGASRENFYDYLILCEVIEHFKSVKNDLERALCFLKPGGLLYIHTVFLTENERFPAWYYHHDKTHVVFFKEKTFLSLSKIFDLELISISLNSVILKKR